MTKRLQCLLAAATVALLSTTASPLLAEHGGPEIVGTIDLPRSVHDLAVNSLTNRLYAAAGERVLVIDGATDTIAAEIPVSDDAGLVVVDELSDRIYVAGSRSVQVIDGRFHAVIDSVPMPEDETPASIAVDPHRGRLYVVTWHPAGVPIPGVLVVDLQTGDAHRIPVDDDEHLGLVMDPLRDRLHVGGLRAIRTLGSGDYAILAARDGLLIPRAINSIDGALYVFQGTGPGPGPDGFSYLRMLDGGTLEAIDTFSARVWGHFGRVAVNPFTRLVYTKVYPEEEEDEDCRVWGLDGLTGGRVLDRPIGCGGAGVAVNAATDRAYVVAGSKILVIDGFHPGPARPVD
jgi:DNA-binding beta-propeller fold protein YncE